MIAPLVMVVDDDTNLREMLRLALESRGYRVVGSADGWKAVEIATLDRPALIILDVHMVVRDGAWVANQLREQGIDVPILILTADRPAHWADEIGAVAWMGKPFDLDELLAKVEAVAPVANAATPPPTILPGTLSP
jgi:DNA-binding response OmpR family regulator